MAQSLKIWDKKTSTSRRPLQQFKTIDEENISKEEVQFNQESSKHSYNIKEKRLINSAMDILKDREKLKENGNKKEGIVELVEQKKEVFLVEMTVDIIQKEIERLKNIINDKKEALVKSEKMLDQDKDDFDKYVDNNKKAFDEAQNVYMSYMYT